ncbi:MAG TPA: MBL fold metallo-hydrolase [Chloroflexota bacterium]|jgi:ribonuclease BN (tRNA processing enzyme)
MRLIMTGTGTPHPCLERAGPSQVVEVAGDLLLFDCGDGTLRQLMAAGVPAQNVSALFLTHLHEDHLVDLTGFIYGSWYLSRRGSFSNKRVPLEVYGPAGTGRMLDALKEAHCEDLEDRARVGLPMQGLFDQQVHPVEPGVILERPGYRVSAAPADHGMEAYAYRIDYEGGSLVLSGDTTYAESVVKLARGADVLVHESHMVDYRPTDPTYAPVWDNIAAIHSTPEQAGRVAHEAGVRRLIVTHLKPDVDAAQTQRRCASEFAGEVTVAEDLMQLAW